jgi:hypothetical protein
MNQVTLSELIERAKGDASFFAHIKANPDVAVAVAAVPFQEDDGVTRFPTADSYAGCQCTSCGCGGSI